MNPEAEDPVANQSLGRQLRQATAVVVADFNMPFLSLVGFMVKVAIAAIPAVIMLAFIFWIVVTALRPVVGIGGPGL